MSALVDRIRLRLIPALLTALGVGLLALGLLSYTDPVAARPAPSASASASPSDSSAAVTSTPRPRITLPPLESRPPAASGAPIASPSPSPSPVASIPADRVATRVRVAALKIDLPVMLQPDPK